MKNIYTVFLIVVFLLAAFIFSSCSSSDNHVDLTDTEKRVDTVADTKEDIVLPPSDSDSENANPDTGDETTEPDTEETGSGETPGGVTGDTGETENTPYPSPDDTNEIIPVEIGPGTITPPGIDDIDEEKQSLISYMEKDAPYKAVLIESTKENGETESSIGYVLPQLEYYYFDIDSGFEFGFNPDRRVYIASVSKLPYLFSVIREIENYENSLISDNEREPDEKYDLSREWVYDSSTMYMWGSGEIIFEDDGFTLTIRELFEYALIYSDNVAFSQLIEMFGYDSYRELMDSLGISYNSYWVTDMMTISEVVSFMKELYAYFDEGSPYAVWMKECMEKSDQGFMIADYYPDISVPHKYGWDIDSFCDAAIVYDEHPYILVILTDYSDGNYDPEVLKYYEIVVKNTKDLHRKLWDEQK